MLQAERLGIPTTINRQPTADFCDRYPAAQVVQQLFLNLGAESLCLGPVETVAARDDNSLVKQVLREEGAGRVLLVDNCGSTNCAMLGGDLARMAANNGWTGVVVNGAVRDVDEIGAVPIAVFALASCPRRSSKRGIGTVGQPVRIGGLLIHSGDILAADNDGIAILPAWAARD
jgi:regulator of ribonuclease activity A